MRIVHVPTIHWGSDLPRRLDRKLSPVEILHPEAHNADEEMLQ